MITRVLADCPRPAVGYAVVKSRCTSSSVGAAKIRVTAGRGHPRIRYREVQREPQLGSGGKLGSARRQRLAGYPPPSPAVRRSAGSSTVSAPAPEPKCATARGSDDARPETTAH